MKQNKRSSARHHLSAPASPFTRLGRCQFFSTDNRRCRMPRWHAHPAYCLHHVRREQQLLETERVAGELVTLTGTFKTAHDVNLVLGKLFTALAQNRIPPGTAATLAYIGSLLLITLPRIPREVADAYGSYRAWDQKLRQLFDDGAAALIPKSEPPKREPLSQPLSPAQ